MTEDIDAHVQRVVAAWPPLTPEQLDRIAFLLQPALATTTGNGSGPEPPSPGPLNLNADTATSHRHSRRRRMSNAKAT